MFWIVGNGIYWNVECFAESTLAQVFKIQDKDGSFRGGPAYYITQGLKSRCLAVALQYHLFLLLVLHLIQCKQTQS